MDEPFDFEAFGKEIQAHIVYHEKMLVNLRFTLKMLRENPPKPAFIFKRFAPLTRDIVRHFLKEVKKPIQTASMIDEFFFPGIKGPEREKQIKILSVILNNLEKNGELIVDKKPGIKGNFYTSKELVDKEGPISDEIWKAVLSSVK